MDGSTRTLPRLRLTVPLPMKTGKVRSRESFEHISRPECRGGVEAFTGERDQKRGGLGGRLVEGGRDF